jgi:hypothetical protein
VLQSFTTRNSDLLDEGEADAEVISPEKDLERAAKARKVCASEAARPRLRRRQVARCGPLCVCVFLCV